MARTAKPQGENESNEDYQKRLELNKLTLELRKKKQAAEQKQQAARIRREQRHRKAEREKQQQTMSTNQAPQDNDNAAAAAPNALTAILASGKVTKEQVRMYELNVQLEEKKLETQAKVTEAEHATMQKKEETQQKKEETEQAAIDAQSNMTVAKYQLGMEKERTEQIKSLTRSVPLVPSVPIMYARAAMLSGSYGTPPKIDGISSTGTPHQSAVKELVDDKEKSNLKFLFDSKSTASCDEVGTDSEVKERNSDSDEVGTDGDIKELNSDDGVIKERNSDEVGTDGAIKERNSDEVGERNSNSDEAGSDSKVADLAGNKQDSKVFSSIDILPAGSPAVSASLLSDGKGVELLIGNVRYTMIPNESDKDTAVVRMEFFKEGDLGKAQIVQLLDDDDDDGKCTRRCIPVTTDGTTCMKCLDASTRFCNQHEELNDVSDTLFSCLYQYDAIASQLKERQHRQHPTSIDTGFKNPSNLAGTTHHDQPSPTTELGHRKSKRTKSDTGGKSGDDGNPDSERQSVPQQSKKKEKNDKKTVPKKPKYKPFPLKKNKKNNTGKQATESNSGHSEIQGSTAIQSGHRNEDTTAPNVAESTEAGEEMASFARTTTTTTDQRATTDYNYNDGDDDAKDNFYTNNDCFVPENWNGESNDDDGVEDTTDGSEIDHPSSSDDSDDDQEEDEDDDVFDPTAQDG